MRNIRANSGALRKGLKIIHIGDDIWSFGKQSLVPGKGTHMVIYGPGNKEYHLWNQELDKLISSDDFKVNRHGNCANESKVKIHILTSILDDPKNWCFDLTIRPNPGPLKVILENGTIKNIEYSGGFYPQELISKRYTYYENPANRMHQFSHSFVRHVPIVGYRIYENK